MATLRSFIFAVLATAVCADAVRSTPRSASAQSDRPFYANNVTKEATWSRPPTMPFFAEDGRPYWLAGSEAAWMPEDEDAAWRPRWSPDGTPFFENLLDGSTTWERPASMGWSVRSSANKFYHNTVTSETTRERPDVLGHADDQRNATFYVGEDNETTWDVPEKAAWRESHSEEHDRVYFHNDQTGDVTWEPPSDSNVAWHTHHDEMSEF